MKIKMKFDLSKRFPRTVSFIRPDSVKIKTKDFKSMHRIIGNPNQRNLTTIYRYENSIQPPKNFVGKKFNTINLNEEPSKIPKNIITQELIQPSEFTVFPIPTDTIIEDSVLNQLLNVCTFLYENGGVYINKPLKIRPNIFIKNREVVFANLDFFASEKNSPIIKDVIRELNEGNIAGAVDIFKERSYIFNDSFKFLV